MGKVTAGFSMSLDGFIADPQDDVYPLFQWLFNGGDTVITLPGTDMVFRTSPASASYFQEIMTTIGVVVTGRRDFDVSKAWGGKPPVGEHCFIVTHHVPPEWAGSANFTFVTDGVKSAVEQARAAAGDKNVAVSGSKIVQQCLQAGLLDEIQIDLVPILLGAGIRLFDLLDQPIELERTRVIDAPGVTHLTFRVVQ